MQNRRSYDTFGLRSNVYHLEVCRWSHLVPILQRTAIGLHLAIAKPEALHMSSHRIVLALAVVALAHFGEIRIAAEEMPTVRVVASEGKVFQRPSTQSEVAAVVPSGTLLNVIDKHDGWFWVLLSPDQNGTRRPGWIQARHAHLTTAAGHGRATRVLTGEVDHVRTALSAPVIKRPKSWEEIEQAREQARVRREERRQERAAARKEREDARAQARLERYAQDVEQARREYEEASQKTVQTEQEKRVEKAAREVEKARREYEALTQKAADAQAR
jgi:hypothetical protein